MREPSQPPKFRVYQEGQRPSEMTGDELSKIIAISMTQARFPSLCDAFEATAMKKFEQHLDGLDINSSDQSIADGRKITKTLLRMGIKDMFQRAVFILTPPIGDLKIAAMNRFHEHHYRCTDQMAGLAIDVMGAYRASQLVPEPMKTEIGAQISDQMNMGNLSALIRRSLR